MHATNKKQDTMEMFLGSVWENLRIEQQITNKLRVALYIFLLLGIITKRLNNRVTQTQLVATYPF